MLIAGSGLAYPIWDQLGQDIDGEAEDDWSGSSVTLSTDGNIVAIGAYGNDGNGAYSGHVRIYQWNETQWIQRGNDIDGEAAYDNSGYSVSLSTDGNIVAIGAYGNDGNGANSGHVRIYQWDGAAWIQRGNDIDGEAGYDYSGKSVSLSADGTIVAIGTDQNDGNGVNSGHVRIYQWNETQWIQRGQDIDGEAEYDFSGSSVTLSTDGNIVAIGAYGNDGNGANSGHVRIYQWNETQWIQRGNDIDGEAASDESGSSVSLSADGNIVAIGARGNDGNGVNSGHVRIYQWNETQWIQRGNDIDGEAGYDFSGSPVSLSTDGNIVAIGAKYNNGNGADSGHVRIYQWNETQWIQRGNDIDGEAGDDNSGSSVSLSTDGSIVAIGAKQNDGNGADSGHVRIYQYHTDSDGDGVADNADNCANTPAGEAVDANGCSEFQKDSDNDGVILADDQCPDTPAGQTVNSNGCDAFQQLELVNQQLQGQIDNISLSPGPQGPIGPAGTNGTDGAAGANGTDGSQGPVGPAGTNGTVGAAGANGTDGTQGPQGKVGATGADADCVACADVANGAVELACLVLGENLPTRVGQVQAAATVIVNTLLISTNICEPTCDIGAEIDALIDAKMNP
jgi:hypothetical protein